MKGEFSTVPMYTYRCGACHAKGTAFRSIAERDRAPKCTQCGGATEKIITSTMVSVFTPYRAVAEDKETGKRPVIRSKAEHQAFLRRNGYEEVGNDRSMAPRSSEEISARRAEQLKAEQPVFDFDPDTHVAQMEATP
jgi:putative FmdB family regulatory protein